MLFRYLTTERLKIPIAIAAGLAFGMVIAVAIGSGDFSTVRRIALVAFGIGVMLFGQQLAWRAAFAVCLLDFYYQGLGFSVSNIEQTGVLALFIILLTWWRKEQVKKPALMETMTFNIFNLSLLAWLLYTAGHLIYNTLDPYNPSEFALKNFLKTVVQFSGPLLLVFYFMHRPTGIVVNRRLPAHLLWVFVLALSVNLGIRLWELSQGSLDPANQIEGETPYFTIPALDLMANYFALRNMGPFVATVCIAFIKGPWFDRQSFVVRATMWLVYGMSIIAAVLSGGRATVVFAFGLSLVVLWLRKYYRLVLALIGAGLMSIIALNLVPDVLRPMPLIMQRSLQLVVITSKSQDALDSINSSSEWRREVITRAFELWRADPRVYWFGRGTYKFGPDDFRALQRNAGTGAMEVSLRRGATHSLVTDLLLVFGVVGFVTYMTMYLCLLKLLWRLWKDPTSDEIAKPIALAAFLLGGFNLTYGILGGATFPLALAWLLVCLFAYLYRVEALRSADHKRQPTNSVPRFAPSLVRGDSLRGRPHLVGARGFSERRVR